MNKLKSLQSKKGRDESGQFLIEGEKNVNEIPDGWNVSFYACAERFTKVNDLSRYEHRAPCVVYRDSVFDAASGTVTPQGIMAVCEQKHYSLDDIIKPGGFLLMGECLSDPGNIGTLIRTAAAAGADGVILTEGSSDIYNPKTLRAAAGAVLRIPVAAGVILCEAVDLMKKFGINIYAAHLKGDISPYALDLRGGICFLIGNEAHGLTDMAAGLADRMIRLPMAGGMESLNASIAGSVLLYEAVRQRGNI